MTFGDVARKVRLYCEMLPANLARDMVQQVYKDLCDREHTWSWLRSEDQLITKPSRSGTCSIVQLDATVTPVAPFTFSAADVTRQIRFTQSLPYSIVSYDSVTGTVELDRPWGGADNAVASTTVLDAYMTMPEDFGSFIAVLDPQNAWQLRTGITEAEINLWDAKRVSSGTPLALASRRLATAPASIAGRVQFELWPYSLTAKLYPYYYYKRAGDLGEDDLLPGLLRTRPDVLETGALWRLSEWPGTSDLKNPYFNTGLAERKQSQFAQQVHDLEMLDQELFLTWLETVSQITRYPWAPVDANFLQSHDDAYYLQAARHW